MDKNYAYVTLLTTNSFLPGTLVLWKSLKDTKPKYPLYCVITPEITQENREILETVGIKLIERSEIPMTEAIRTYNDSIKHSVHGWYKAFSKFHVFGLEQFDKIVYLDSDLYIKTNLDNLFEKPHMSGAIDAEGVMGEPYDYLVEGDNYFKYFNSGLLVIEPKLTLYESMRDFINNIVPDRILADQNILALYYPEWKNQKELRLSIYYNIFASCIESYLDKTWFDINSVKVFHFIGQKPWTLNKQSYMNLNNTYGQLGVDYINILNNIVQALKYLGFESEDLKIIP